MDRYILNYKGKSYFNSNKELEKYLKESGIEKELNSNNDNMMMVYNYSYTEKTCTIKLIKKY
jgi:hypothetical protein